MVIVLELLYVALYSWSLPAIDLYAAVADGRKPIYLLSLSIQCVGTIGVGTSRTVPLLLFWRVIQAFGSSSGLSVGMGVIGDIYRIEERGTASGIFFAVSPAPPPYVILFWT